MLTIHDVEKLAELARIQLSEEEKKQITPTLESILGYVGEIGKVVTEELPSRVGVVKNVLREDVDNEEAGIFTERILENAPDTDAGYVKVKQMF